MFFLYHDGKGFGHHFKRMIKMFAKKAPEMFNKIMAYMSTYINEEGENTIVEIDMPGFEKDNIEVKAGDYYLEVNAERDYTEEEIKLRGTEKKTFSVSLDLTSKVKVNEIKATYTNGVLRVVLKKEPEKKVEVD
jgi:HSP20 family molecular chaperone IbpA